VAKPTWYAPSENSWTLKIPGSGRLWKIALGLAAAALCLLVLFTGDKSLVSLLAMYKQRAQAVAEIADLKKTNQKLQQQIGDLRVHPEAVEPIAREELGLVRIRELVYRFVPAPAAPSRDASRPEPKPKP
jgi:cell division protein FtsB